MATALAEIQALPYSADAATKLAARVDDFRAQHRTEVARHLYNNRKAILEGKPGRQAIISLFLAEQKIISDHCALHSK